MIETVAAPAQQKRYSTQACYHCGRACDEIFRIDDKSFCCIGCKTVFEILNENNLCEYYQLDGNAGVSRSELVDVNFSYLDEISVRKKVLKFDSETFAAVDFHIPAIHCVSCIWLLERLQTINAGVLRCEVNFPRKSITLQFNPSKIKLSELTSLISRLGYSPEILLEQTEEGKARIESPVLKLTIAAFCFGNVMLFSFPEYLGLDGNSQSLMKLFSSLNVALSIPVFFYCANDYFKSSLKSFRQRQINIDVPIGLGLVALFSRSMYDIITMNGPGYLDSFTGLVFFLLIGRWFQSKTYKSLSFDRDYKSYFPLAVDKNFEGCWQPVVIYELKAMDEIRIRNMEIIPADSLLLDEQAYIDYSFVTGESKPTTANKGDLIYAGGRLIGSPITLRVTKQISQSHLTSLWNNSAFKKITHNRYQRLIDLAAQKFTWIVLAIALLTAIYWQLQAPGQMWLILTSVLMVACPCALALAAPFTYGSMLRVFGKRHLYLRNSDVIEQLAHIDAVVFDKTGTVTMGHTPEILYDGVASQEDLAAIKALTGCSAHPLSQIITKSIQCQLTGQVVGFKEIHGQGIQGVINGIPVKIGSAKFIGVTKPADPDSSSVCVCINEKVKGEFRIRIRVRDGVSSMLRNLGKKCFALLSGDNDADKRRMSDLFPTHTELVFNQNPHDKLEYIRSLQRANKKILMVGDGLNDAGALKQSDVGIAVSDNTAIFSPASDGILAGDKVRSLDVMLKFAKSSSLILKTGFAISFFYNAIALTIAVSGNLTPLIAAILMPISSISVVSFSTIAVKLSAMRHKF
jgi:P-type Cu+ transporter